MDSRRILLAVVLTLLVASEPGAQNRVRTETIIPPADVPVPAAPSPSSPAVPGLTPATPATPLQIGPPGITPPPAPPPIAAPKPLPPVRLPPITSAGKPYGRAGARPGQKISDVITDLKLLPAPVARMRARIIEAARTGDLDKLVTVMQTNETMPIFSFANERDPVAYWRTNYPESGGLEVLSILLEILDMGFVHVDAGTPQDMYVWPYFAYLPLKDLTAAQKVELFKVVTGSDYRAMQDFGAYIFYRVGIAPDGTWHFFVSGE
ncbi:MAG: hypothetical protein JO328_16455 [Hyphomicrobiales bacterium]|nr:hypothetical protein [Hyphomicrobiales bacterium]MBV8823474.1 hypothetical protein [Hyphomicrobiales bacterium]